MGRCTLHASHGDHTRLRNALYDTACSISRDLQRRSRGNEFFDGYMSEHNLFHYTLRSRCDPLIFTHDSNLTRRGWCCAAAAWCWCPSWITDVGEAGPAASTPSPLPPRCTQWSSCWGACWGACWVAAFTCCSRRGMRCGGPAALNAVLRCSPRLAPRTRWRPLQAAPATGSRSGRAGSDAMRVRDATRGSSKPPASKACFANIRRCLRVLGSGSSRSSSSGCFSGSFSGSSQCWLAAVALCTTPPLMRPAFFAAGRSTGADCDTPSVRAVLCGWPRSSPPPPAPRGCSDLSARWPAGEAVGVTSASRSTWLAAGSITTGGGGGGGGGTGGARAGGGSAEAARPCAGRAAPSSATGEHCSPWLPGMPRGPGNPESTGSQSLELDGARKPERGGGRWAAGLAVLSMYRSMYGG